MENLTKKECDTLIDALDAWETKDSSSRLMGGLLTAMFSKDLPPEAQAELKEKERLEEEKREMEQRERKETSLLLKAKLVQMKQSITLDAANKILQS